MSTDTSPQPDQLDDQAATDADEADSFDPLAALTIDELNDGSRQLRASLVTAITQQTEHYEKALAVLLWLHKRRSEPGIGLGGLLSRSFTSITDELQQLRDVDPTAPRRSP